MIAAKPYQRAHAVEYARTWALSRNPLFSRFDTFGGDCTNFVSQCIFVGSCVMNETPTFGWYYRAAGDYAPAWTGVPYLYNFLTENMDVGPFGEEIPIESTEPGDVIQLGRNDGTFYHTLIVVGMRDGVPLICAHDNDALDRSLSTYTYERARAIHILGVRFRISASDCCYEGMLTGRSIFPTPASAAALSCYPQQIPMEDMEDETEPSTPSEPMQEAPITEDRMSAESKPRPADILPDDFVFPRSGTEERADLPSE